MEKEEELKYEVYLRGEDPLPIRITGEERGLKLQEALFDKDNRFVKIDDQIIAISEIRKVIEVKPIISKEFILPEEASMTPEEKEKSLKRIEEMKKRVLKKLKKI